MQPPRLAWLLALAGAIHCGAAVLHASDAPSRPNIVLIFSDDHAYQAISAYGDSRHLIDTPNIDRIAKEGMRFDRCLVTNSICGPSRATVLTGKYSHENGFYHNVGRARFDGTQQTFPKLLQKAGYQTAIVGKWHLTSDPTGFDFWQILPGQGVYYNPPMIRNGQRIPTHGHVTDVTADAALDWLAHRDTAKPFLLMFQQKAPHRNWQPNLRDLDFDHDRKYPLPDTLFDDYSGRGRAEHEQDMMIATLINDEDTKLTPPRGLDPEQRKAWDAYYQPRLQAFRDAHLSGRALVEWKYQRFLHDYLACVKGVDDSVGRLLNYLDEHGLSENTVVVYASDQGFFLGEHGWFDKRWIFEESLRTPLLVRWPKVIRPGSVNRSIVSNLDFAETFLDIAQAPVPSDMQGRSLVPLFRQDASVPWRQSFYYQYYEWPFPCRVRPHYGVVTDRYKLVRFYGTGEDYTELFDLQTDPREMTDVAQDPRYRQTVQELEQELARLRRQLHVPDTVTPDKFGQRGQRRASNTANDGG